MTQGGRIKQTYGDDDHRETERTIKVRIRLAPPEDTLNLDMLAEDKPEGTFFINARHPGIDEDTVQAAVFSFGAQQAKGGDISLTGDVRGVAGFIQKCVVQITGFCLPVTDLSGQEREQTWDPTKNGDNEENRKLYVRLLDPALVIGPEGETFSETLTNFLDAVAGRGTEAAEKHEEQKKRQS